MIRWGLKIASINQSQ